MTDTQATDSALRQFAEVLRRRYRIVLLCVLIGSGVAIGVSLLLPNLYTSTASLLFRDSQLDDRLLGRSLQEPVQQPSADPDREAATNVLLVSLDVVADRTATALDRGIDGEDVEQKIDVEPQGQSSIVDVSATDESAEFAQSLAATFAGEYIAFRRAADRGALRRTEQRIESQLSAPDTGLDADRRDFLERRAEDIEILKSLQTGEAELVQRATLPEVPSSPKPLQNAAAGLALGFLLGLALAFVRERLDRRFGSPEEVEQAFGRPLLGAIPESPAFAVGKDQRSLALGAGESAPRPAFGAFGLLWANLRYFNAERPLQSVLITSAGRGEGKTTVALNLATAAAVAGARVLLLEADLRQPSLGARLGVASPSGLAHVLSRVADAQEVAYRVPLGNSQNGAIAEQGFDVIFAGPPPPNPADLLDSDAARALLNGAVASGYDLVVVDSPPIPIVPDAIPLVSEVSGVIVVSRLDRTERELAARLRSQLENLDARTMGVVVNSAGSEKRYGYDYGYGHRASSG